MHLPFSDMTIGHLTAPVIGHRWCNARGIAPYALMSVFKSMDVFFHSHLRVPNIYGCAWAEARL
jgi:hypothetical protein